MIEVIRLVEEPRDPPPSLEDVLAQLRQDFARGMNLDVFIKRLLAKSEPGFISNQKLLGRPVIITRTHDDKILVGTSYDIDPAEALPEEENIQDASVILKAVAWIDPTFKNLQIRGKFQHKNRIWPNQQVTDIETDEIIDRDTKARELIEALPFGENK